MHKKRYPKHKATFHLKDKILFSCKLLAKHTKNRVERIDHSRNRACRQSASVGYGVGNVTEIYTRECIDNVTCIILSNILLRTEHSSFYKTHVKIFVGKILLNHRARCRQLSHLQHSACIRHIYFPRLFIVRVQTEQRTAKQLTRIIGWRRG